LACVKADAAPDGMLLGRPAIPIDNAAFAYHWSDLKITRRALFFSGLTRESGFLALADRDAVSFAAAPFALPFEGMFFAIVIHPLNPHRAVSYQRQQRRHRGKRTRPRQKTPDRATL
jgi:hypothetical protein